MSVDAYIAFLERVTPDTVDALYDHVHPDVRFKDPFNDVRGAAAMHAVLADMFAHVDDLVFKVHETATTGRTTFIAWTLSGTLSNRPWSVDGTSRLVVDDNGKLLEHIDYWDAASGLYERIPVIGWLLRRLRRRLRVDTPPRP